MGMFCAGKMRGLANGRKMMKNYVIGRFLQMVPMLLCITFLAFAAMRLAGDDAVDLMYEKSGGVSEEVKAAKRAELGLDQPFLVQYGAWLKGAVTGDMGKSYISGKPVWETFMEKLPATLYLMLASVLMTLAFAVPLGILAAARQNRQADVLIRIGTFVGNSLPNFFVGLLLIYVFAVRLEWLPILAKAGDGRAVILPALTLAIAMGAKYTRQIRAVVLEELAKPYVVGARARGVKDPCEKRAAQLARAHRHAARTVDGLSSRRYGDRRDDFPLGRCGKNGGRGGLGARLSAGAGVCGMDGGDLCRAESCGGYFLPSARSARRL